jgi:hypothetical protein
MGQLAAGMLVPEASVNEDDLASTGEGDIGPSGSGPPLETEPVSKPV